MTVGPVIWTEGIIGAGKSTLTEQIAKALNLRPLYEPVGTNTYLEDFYKDPKRWALSMQYHLLAERYNMQKLAFEEACRCIEYNGAILDRGLPGDRVFCKMHMLAGNIHPREWESYQRLYEIMTLSLHAPSLLIFLDVEPEVAHERVVKRARGAETGLTLKYLQDLRKGYLDLMCEIESGKHSWSRGMSILRLPWNIDHQPIDGLVDELAHRYRIERKR